VRFFEQQRAIAGSTVRIVPFIGLTLLAVAPFPAFTQTGENFELYVTNERSNDVTVIDAASQQPVATIAAGKRPRGIHVSPDGKLVYVALSGNPIGGPPPDVGAKGSAPAKKAKADDDDDDVPHDKSADGIGIIDVAQRKVLRKISVGSDPEEFDLNRAGTQFYVSNEDVKAASVVDIASGKVEHIIPVSQEPEGVATSPDGKSFYVTCEANGDIFIIDASSYRVTGQFTVPVRPRNVEFLAGTSLVFVPSESVGLLNIADTSSLKVVKTLTLPEGSRPMRVRVSPDGQRVYISEGRAGTVDVLDAHTYALLDTIKVGTRPWGLVLSPDGKYLYTANGPSNDVSVVDLRTDKEIARIKAGQSPWGLTVVPKGH
jgi:YVTN family beta-propeller protein